MDESTASWVSTRRAAKRLGVCAKTVRAWAIQNNVRQLRTPGGHLRFAISDFTPGNASAADSGQERCKTTKKTVGYARVSSQGQKEQLEHQVEYIRGAARPDDIISEIGSAVNFEKAGLQRLLERVLRGGVGQIVIAHRDRLCRIGYGLIE